MSARRTCCAAYPLLFTLFLSSPVFDGVSIVSDSAPLACPVGGVFIVPISAPNFQISLHDQLNGGDAAQKPMSVRISAERKPFRLIEALAIDKTRNEDILNISNVSLSNVKERLARAQNTLIIKEAGFGRARC
jgi:hypothetical protein